VTGSEVLRRPGLAAVNSVAIAPIFGMLPASNYKPFLVGGTLMKLARLAVALVAFLSVAGLAYVAQQAEPAGSSMVMAAQNFLDGLKADQKQQATFPYDSKERTNWNFTPQQDASKKSTRKGLPLEDMTPDQKKAALALLRAGTSETGNVKATTIMSLEAILRAQEKKGAMVRNPEWYFFTVFGTPGKTGQWGWRVEGHHLSLNFTMDGTQVVAATPFFFGANPAEVKDGARKGLRILAPAEDLAKDLYNALSDDQKQVAHQQNKFPEPTEKSVAPKVGAPVGLAAAKMTGAQKKLLMKLLTSYIERMPPDVGALEMKNAKEAGMDNVHFAFAGTTEPGQGMTYRVQGPTFVIEFLNIQADSAGNRANHIHSAWRRIKGDFGLN
jgi:hypothetical protein